MSNEARSQELLVIVARFSVGRRVEVSGEIKYIDRGEKGFVDVSVRSIVRKGDLLGKMTCQTK